MNFLKKKHSWLLPTDLVRETIFMDAAMASDGHALLVQDEPDVRELDFVPLAGLAGLTGVLDGFGRRTPLVGFAFLVWTASAIAAL